MFDSNNNYTSNLSQLISKHSKVNKPNYSHFKYGPDHSPVFVCVCQCEKETTIAYGRTKKEATNGASKEMLSVIQFVVKADKHHDTNGHHSLGLHLPKKLLPVIESLHLQPRYDILSLYGDSLLRCFLAEYLYIQYPFFKEDILTEIISQMLSQETRASIAKYFNFYIKTETTTRTLSQSFSAFIGQLVLLENDVVCKSVILKEYKPIIKSHCIEILSSQLQDVKVRTSETIQTDIHNYKSKLFDLAARNKLNDPIYDDKAKSSSDVSNLEFIWETTCHFLNQTTMGQGKTKIIAHQEASRNMLTKILRNEAKTFRRVKKSSFRKHSKYKIKKFNAVSLRRLKKAIGWKYFNTLENLNYTFTHPSKHPHTNYQRLEFLGDAIIKKIILAHIVQEYQKIVDKGVLSQRIDLLISKQTQAKVAIKLNLDSHIFTSAEITDSIRSDVLEALVATIFLDNTSKSDKVERCVLGWFQHEINIVFKNVNQR